MNNVKLRLTDLCFFCLLFCSPLLHAQVRSRSGFSPVPSDRRQNGHRVSTSGGRIHGRSRVLQALHGSPRAAGLVHGDEGRHAAAELRQTRPGRQIHSQVPGVQS